MQKLTVRWLGKRFRAKTFWIARPHPELTSKINSASLVIKGAKLQILLTRFLVFFLPNLPATGIGQIIPGKGEFGKWHPGWGGKISKPLFTVQILAKSCVAPAMHTVSLKVIFLVDITSPTHLLFNLRWGRKGYLHYLWIGASEETIPWDCPLKIWLDISHLPHRNIKSITLPNINLIILLSFILESRKKFRFKVLLIQYSYENQI